MPKAQPFNASTVKLYGSNLIEASAGTGKTYSIAIMALRLILEKKISVKEILMVTFTKAAVAELEERIRLFVRSAYKVSKGETIKDKTITALVNDYNDKAEAKRLLNEAVLFLDETSVLTIHSFCQKTLNEFAFETSQLFGAETLKDTGNIIEEEINKFWRQHITVIPLELLKQFMSVGLSRESIRQVVKEHLTGKDYFPFNAKNNYTLGDNDYPGFISLINELAEDDENIRNSLIQYIIDNSAQLKIASNGNRYAKKTVLPLIDTPFECLTYIIEKRGSDYVKDLFADVLEKSDECEAKIKQNEIKFQEIISKVLCFAIQQSIKGIDEYKQRNNQMSFDDMIVRLHDALVEKESNQLATALQNKYKAVFIDEFQDTDRLQYEIFQKAFSSNSILFYIGDPKQSIYAWRKADIATYFRASATVGNIYDMNQNFRSSAPMIEAMNLFFEPVKGFDTFSFKGDTNSINYIPVQSPSVNKQGLLCKADKAVIPITITTRPNNDAIYSAVAAQVVDLMVNKAYKINEPGKQRNIKPSDIGILVKTNKQGYKVKAELATYGIPAVTIGDDKVLQSAEAVSLLYLLEAFNDISRASINKALFSSFTGYSKENIIQLDEERTLQLFKKYKSRWEEVGIFTALMDFVADFNVQKNLLLLNTSNGERIITNLFHLIELVHKVQTAKLLSPIELISWLKRASEGMEIEGDEYEQRVENDEDAIKIVTIHKSKGLEYKIVLAPFLDLMTINEHDMSSFRDPANGEYVSVEKKCLTDVQKATWVDQQEQENRRLIYVAITRAVYKCFIYKNTSNKGKYNYSISSLATFTDALVNADISLIEQTNEPVLIPENYRYSNSNAWAPFAEIKNVHFSLTHPNWTKMSYTTLAAKHDGSIKRTGTQQPDAYNEFVFHQLSKGEKTGNLLHTILETINYNSPERWPTIIDTAITRFAPGQRPLYQKMLGKMVEQILSVSIESAGSSLKLADVALNKRIHEFEFDFPVNTFSTSKIVELSDEIIQINMKSLGELEGIMNGIIDLFFEHEGKYFILDWKSNFLGDTLDDYSAAGVANAMNENNYHLQYMIYTVAVKKYLESRLPGFDYERDFGGVIYLFLRGVRKDSSSGVYWTKPSIEKIESLEGMLNLPEEEISEVL